MAFLCLFSLSVAFAAGDFSGNQWTLQSGVFFVDHPGGDLVFNCKTSHPKRSGGKSTPAILITIYTPDEHVQQDFYWFDKELKRKKTFSCTIPNAQKGIWQIRVAQDDVSKFTYQFDIAPGKIEAFYPARCWSWHQAGQIFDDTYVMVPKNAKEPLTPTVHNCATEFFYLNGKSVCKIQKGGPVKVLEPGKIYRHRYTASQPGYNWFGYGGFPLIFCRTPEFAKRLNASLIELPDGKIVPLAVQKRVIEWKKTLKKEDFTVPELDLMKYKEALAADPEAWALVQPTGALAAAAHLIAIQDVDPASPKFGSARDDLGALAFLYTLNKPYNPYYKNKGVLNRIALYYLDFQTNHPRFALKENGTKYETSSNYAGADGMLQVPQCTAFYLVAHDLDPKVREMWTELLGYPARRFFSDRVSCENQSGHWPAKLYLYGKGADNPLFVTLAQNFIDNLGNTGRSGFIRTGYLEEAYGPDATYQGLDSCLLAYYAFFSRDPAGYQLVDRINTLFNHTVAPEPNGGKIYGASGFSHRTPGGWNLRQYGGGTRLVADKLASAACWHQEPPEAWNLERCQQQLEWIANNKLTFYAKNPDFLNYTFRAYARVWDRCPEIRPIPQSVLPMVPDEEFDHIFNDEFYFFRRKSYYAGAYAGKTAGSAVWQNLAKPYPGKWSEKDGVQRAQTGEIFGAMQGPQLFWTPEYGTALLCMNWNLYTRWNARLTDGKTLDWPTYFASERKYDAAKKELVLTNKFRTLPVTIERTLQFTGDALSVKLKTRGDFSGKILVEQLPYLDKEGITAEFCINGEWKNAPGSDVSALRWKNSSGAGVVVTFSRPVIVRKGVTSASQGVQIGSFDVEIANAAAADFGYLVSAIK